jgi:hypothetical protein
MRNVGASVPARAPAHLSYIAEKIQVWVARAFQGAINGIRMSSAGPWIMKSRFSAAG